MVLHAFKSRIFQLQTTEGTGNPDIITPVAHVPTSLKILSSKQMLQRLPIVLARYK